MNEQVKLDNFADIRWKFGGGIKLLLGHKVAWELLQINIDFNDTHFFEEKIRYRGHGTYTKGECLNAMLDYYSILEIAFKVDFISVLDSKLSTEIIYFLKEGNVKNYCFLIYRSLLPIQLLDRLQYGSQGRSYDDDPSVISMLFQFLDIYEYVLQSNSVIRFLSADTVEQDEVFAMLSEVDSASKPFSKKLLNGLMGGYFRYMEFLQMIGNYFEETRFYPDLQTGVASFFIRLIDEGDERVNFILEGTAELYDYYIAKEHQLIDDRSRYDYEDAFEEFQKTLRMIKSTIAQLELGVLL